MIEEAEAMGADGIINGRYMTTSVVSCAAELLGCGTAVKLGWKRIRYCSDDGARETGASFGVGAQM